MVASGLVEKEVEKSLITVSFAMLLNARLSCGGHVYIFV